MGASSENVYVAPQTHATPRWRVIGYQSLTALIVSFAFFGAGLSIAWTDDGNVVVSCAFVVSALAGCMAFLLGIISLRKSTSEAFAHSAFPTLVVLGGVVGGFAMTTLGACLAFVASSDLSRGRQLRRRGKVLRPNISENDSSWVTMQIDAEIPGDSRSALARAWRENGQTEHASVAAFARLTLDLMALGAPPDLIAASNQDALDEIRHAELCFSLARGIDGREKSPAPFPEAARARTLSSLRKIAIAQLAVDSLIDGALHEGASARVAAALAKKCESPQIKAVLKQIAADEGRHAAHGWDVVEWCVAVGGASTAHALLGAARALPIEMHASLPADAEDGSWEKFGIMGRALEGDAYPKTRAQVMRRVEQLAANYLKPAANSSTTHTLPSASKIAATP